jgi:hypothetical protein
MSLFTRPDVQRLLEIARSTNALVALAVERRELSWTRFMAWFLDPARHDPSIASDRLSKLIHRNVTSILTVLPEQSVGKKGRVDLLIECQVAAGRSTVLIENKIDHREHAGQLAAYVQAVDGEVLPLFIELGDAPARKCSCSTAACLDRRQVADWLRSCEPLPSIAQDYLQLFEAWDIASTLRRSCVSEIDATVDAETPPPEWSLVQHWLKGDETPFYEAVLETPVLVDAMNRHGFESGTSGRMRSENAILKLWSESWTHQPQPPQRGVQVHFEANGKGKLHLHIELYPYIGSVGKNRQLLKLYRPQLQLRTRLHEIIRPALYKIPGITVNDRSLRKVDDPAANSAGSFVSGLGANCTPQEHADFIARTIDAVAPVIGRHIREIITHEVGDRTPGG